MQSARKHAVSSNELKISAGQSTHPSILSNMAEDENPNGNSSKQIHYKPYAKQINHKHQRI